MKVTFCLESTFNSGGMERMLSIIANAIGLEHNVTVITAFNEKRQDFFPFEKMVRRIDLGIKREKFVHSSKSLKTIYRNRLEKVLLDNPQDITISLGSLEFFFLYKLKDTSKKILWFHFALNYDVMTCRETPIDNINHLIGRIKTYRRFFIASKYNHVVCLSKADLSKWEKHIKNVSLIYNPISIEKSESPNYKTKSVIAVGRLDRQKGFDVLINAWEILSTKFPDWCLDIYGEGSMREQLQKQINDLHLQDVVKLRGRSNKISQEFSRHSLMVLSSWYEGFALVLIEASTCAIAQVAFDCESGPSEIIYDHKSGILVQPVGNCKNLANALSEMMASEEKRKQYGLYAELLSKRFRIQNIKEQWLEVFRNLNGFIK